MRRLRVAGLFLAPALLFFPTQAGAAKPQPQTVKRTAEPVWTLAMDGSRVAYASAGRVYVWNVATGATSVVKGNYSNVTHSANAAELAIAGTRVAWIKRVQVGNTQLPTHLYTARLGGPAHQVKHVYRYGVDDPTLTKGGWIEGLVGAGKHLVVSAWKSDGTTAADEQLSLVTPKGLSALAGGTGAIVSQAIGGGHIAVLSSSPWSTSTSAASTRFPASSSHGFRSAPPARSPSAGIC